MESIQISRKRMRVSSTEILTKSKSVSQRDGPGRRFAPPANGFCLHQSPSLSGKLDSKIIRTYPRVTIKDLRLRRVFTPRSISTDCDFKTKGANPTKELDDDECPFDCDSHTSSFAKEGIKTNASGLGNAEAGEFLPSDPKLLSSGPISSLNGVERNCEEINGAAVKKNGTNICSKSVLRPCSRAKIFKNPGSLSYKRLLPYLMQAADDGTSSGGFTKPEKPIAQGPPGINMLCEKQIGETGENPKEEVSELKTAKCHIPETTTTVSQASDKVSDKHSAGSLCGNNSPSKKVIAPSPSKKPVYPRRKLFKTPGSVNYRRMLPYLRGAPETVNIQDHEKNITENTPSSMLVSENEGAQEIVPANAARESDTSFNENEESLVCDHVSVYPVQSDPDKEQETQVKHVILDTEKSSETAYDDFCAEVLLSTPLSGSEFSSEAAPSALNDMFVEKLAGEENKNGSGETEAKNGAEELEADCSNLTSELLDPSVKLGTPPTISPSKGILKRSIRGCRGICSCLNCSAFRLNAERAFEFSRNQLQDTEVMVLDLVGEISHLRDLLEKYNSADHDESYKTQAGEAGKRAFEAAELAKGRLHQMNDELQVHCRIPNEQRARVKFAHYIHEKTILEASEPLNHPEGN